MRNYMMSEPDRVRRKMVTVRRPRNCVPSRLARSLGCAVIIGAKTGVLRATMNMRPRGGGEFPACERGQCGS